MEELKIGDSVTLKSGSPIMVIDEILNGKANCIWFDAKKNKNSGLFILETLIKYNEPKNGGIYFSKD